MNSNTSTRRPAEASRAGVLLAGLSGIALAAAAAAATVRITPQQPFEWDIIGAAAAAFVVTAFAAYGLWKGHSWARTGSAAAMGLVGVVPLNLVLTGQVANMLGEAYFDILSPLMTFVFVVALVLIGFAAAAVSSHAVSDWCGGAAQPQSYEESPRKGVLGLAIVGLVLTVLIPMRPIATHQVHASSSPLSAYFVTHASDLFLVLVALVAIFKLVARSELGRTIAIMVCAAAVIDPVLTSFMSAHMNLIGMADMPGLMFAVVTLSMLASTPMRRAGTRPGVASSAIDYSSSTAFR